MKGFKKLLVVALKPEWAFLKSRFTFEPVASQKDFKLFCPVSETHWALLQTGMGLENAKKSFRGFLKNNSCETVLHFGVSGALVPELKAGDLVMADAILFEKILEKRLHRNGSCLDTPCSPKGEPGYIEPPVFNFLPESHFSKISKATLLTVTTPLRNAQEKKLAHEKTGAAIVDMESYAIAQICEKNHIKYTSVRAVFDECTEDLCDMPRSFDESGDLKPKGLVIDFIKSPQLIFKLPNLKKRMDVIQIKLAEVVFEFLKD